MKKKKFSPKDKKQKKSDSDLYLYAFYFSQLFEFMLRFLLLICIEGVRLSLKTKQFNYSPQIDDNWNANDYFQRLLTFFPKKSNPKFYTTVRRAIEARNDFVHGAFKPNSDSLTIPDNKDNILNFNSLKKLYVWMDAFRVAYNEISSLLVQFSDNKEKMTRKLRNNL